MRALRGRTNRALYWVGLCTVALLFTVLNLLSSNPVGVSEAVLIFLCVPRLHDIGKSGWFVLIGVGIELVAMIIGFSFFSLDDARSVIGWGTLIILGLLVWLGTIPGNPGPNAWGEPPAPGLQL